MDADGIRLGTNIGCLVRRQVVGGQDPGQLVFAQALEEARGGEVAGPAIPAGQGLVGDLADDRLDEPVLASLRGTWFDGHLEQLAFGE